MDCLYTWILIVSNHQIKLTSVIETEIKVQIDSLVDVHNELDIVH